MDSAARARELFHQGRLSDAARLLKAVASAKLDSGIALLKATTCELVGEVELAESTAFQVLRSRSLADSQRALGELILARVSADRGDRERELQHLQKSQSAAEKAGDPNQLGWTQLRLLTSTADRSGIESCHSLMSALRRNVSCAGNPALTAALHLSVADIDGKQGFLAKSQRHVHLARSILARYPNLWLEAWSECTLFALAIVKSDVPAATSHGDNALKLSEDSGACSLIRGSLANLGSLRYTVGDFDAALRYLNQALEMTAENQEQRHAILDSIARVNLAQGRIEESQGCLEWLVAAEHDSDSCGYVYRHSLLTKAELLKRTGRTEDAIRCLEVAIELARRSGDSLLADAAMLLRMEMFDLAERDKVSSALKRSSATMMATPNTSILYERALMSLSSKCGNDMAALTHRNRAARTCRAVTNKPAEDDLNIAWEKLTHGQVCQSGSAQPSTLVQDVSFILMHAGRPELVATGLISILQHANCIVGARAVSRSADGAEELLDSCGTITDAAAVRTFAIGTASDRAVEIHLQPQPDVESHATVNSIGFIIAAGQELERSRLEREERLTLWPIDELPAEDDDSVVAGKMREVMIYARKIAQSNVTVLITGESGTGKEVLARAVHRYSPRSKKPFVPFNCTAVPRELIESHLFGFKRGAFTGADRDNPGLIRAAKDGTLFLDEIGELSLDLQPKLLRFLESGEINPLGEPTPFAVNVRIVAATNANLRKLVEEGRFREDLYYRLSVIPLELPPLRERREEIAPLAQHFALKWSHELGKGCIRVAEDLMEHLVLYPWPGNVRQLSNEINRMVATAEPNRPLTLDLLPRALREETEQLKRRASGLEMAVPLTDKLERAVSTLEREMIKVALRQHDGKVEAAARALGISRKGLYLKRQRLGL